MAVSKPIEKSLTMKCLGCDWIVEVSNSTVGLTAQFKQTAIAHADEHEQHAVEIVQTIPEYSENYKAS